VTASSKNGGDLPAKRGRKIPWSLRDRVSLLYGGKRRRVLAVPLAALRKVTGEVEVDPEARWARARFPDGSEVEAGFRGKARVFGVLIDTVWTGRRGSCHDARHEIRYRFKPGRFRAADRDGEELAAALSADQEVRRLVAAAELKALRLVDCDDGRLVEAVSLPGTITALYLPPMPPYTVIIRPEEAAAQLALVRRLLEAADGG